MDERVFCPIGQHFQWCGWVTAAVPEPHENSNDNSCSAVSVSPATSTQLGYEVFAEHVKATLQLAQPKQWTASDKYVSSGVLSYNVASTGNLNFCFLSFNTMICLAMDGVVREVNVRVLGNGVELLCANGGRFEINRVGGGWMIFHFFDCLSPFSFLLIEFHCTFSISYRTLPYYVYYYCILIR